MKDFNSSTHIGSTKTRPRPWEFTRLWTMLKEKIFQQDSGLLLTSSQRNPMRGRKLNRVVDKRSHNWKNGRKTSQARATWTDYPKCHHNYHEITIKIRIIYFNCCSLMHAMNVMPFTLIFMLIFWRIQQQDVVRISWSRWELGGIRCSRVGSSLGLDVGSPLATHLGEGSDDFYIARRGRETVRNPSLVKMTVAEDQLHSIYALSREVSTVA